MGKQLKYEDHIARILARLARGSRADAQTARLLGRKTEGHALDDVAEFLEYATHHADQLVWQLSLFDQPADRLDVS